MPAAAEGVISVRLVINSWEIPDSTVMTVTINSKKKKKKVKNKINAF